MKLGRNLGRLLGNASNLAKTSVRLRSDVVIASAVRTPIAGNLRGVMTGDECAALAVEIAVRQSSINFESITEAYFSNPFIQDTISDALYGGMPNGVCIKIANRSMKSGMQAIVSAARSLKLNPDNAVLAGEIYDRFDFDHTEEGAFHTADIWSIEEKHVRQYSDINVRRTKRAWEYGSYDSEILPLSLAKTEGASSRQGRGIMQDTVYHRLPNTIDASEDNAKTDLSDGASALVLTTNRHAKRLGVTPLARIVGYEEYQAAPIDYPAASAIATIRVLQANSVDKNEVDMYEVFDPLPIIPLSFMSQLKINNRHVNIHGGIYSLKDNSSMSGARMVTHLAHNLLPNQVGVATIVDNTGVARSLLLEGLLSNWTSKLPRITIMTRPTCYLCEEMADELARKYPHQYELHKFDITNTRYAKLYNNDIPVLFLNGKFVCMHRLNHRLLSHRLRCASKEPI